MSPQSKAQNKPRKQTLLLMKGHPGSGKSTLAAGLAQTFGWALLDKDDIKDHLLHVEDGNALAYEILWAMTRRLLVLGQSVIVDSPLSYPQSYATGKELAAQVQAELLVVETRPPEDVWQARLDTRPAHASRHKVASWAAMQRLLSDYDGCWRYPIDPAHHLVVDSSGPVAAAVAAVAKKITKKNAERDQPPMSELEQNE